MKYKKVAFIPICIAFCAFSMHKSVLFRIPKGWPAPIYDFKKNPPTIEKINLGRALFYDPLLSGDNSISCASCHAQSNAFTHTDHALSHGINDRIGIRNSPVLINMAWQSSFMWDGAVNHLDVQALAPIHNKVEMDEDISNVLIKLKNSPVYPELFYQAYGDSIISGERVLKAISQFMLTLVSANSKYDQVMRNEREFTPQEANGYALFKQHCSSCHTEPLFTNHTFKSNSLQIDSGLNDFGRVSITSMPEDSFLFKVPTLRNIEFSFPYMHDGRFNSLLEVMNHYTNRDPLVSNTSQELSGKITLTSEQKVDIIAFLTTLSDKEFLFNPNYSFPRHLLLKNKPISNK